MKKRMLNNLQKEAEEIQYSLRSSFFYRRHQEFKRLIDEVYQLDCTKHKWENSSKIGITSSSWEHIEKKGITPCRVFCHPTIISNRPCLVAYYRLIAGLSQKGVFRLAFGVKPLEERKVIRLDEKRAIQLAKVFNSYICSIIDSNPDFTVEDALIVGQMNFGTQINGSWRNEIGNEGSRRIRELILKHFLEERLVSQIVSKDGSLLPPSWAPIEIDDIQGFIAKNDYKVVFGTEPDISIISPDGTLDGAIEVKAGIDPAGALERYGAAKKSFDQALRRNKSAITIYLASCVTEGVKKAMADDRLVRKAFNLTRVFLEDKSKEEFFKYIRWVMHL
jgi:hypothetical protein